MTISQIFGKIFMAEALDFYQWVYHIRKAIEKNDTFTLVGLHEAHADLMTCHNHSDEELVFIKAYEHVFNKGNGE